MSLSFLTVCPNCQNNTMVDRDYMFRNGQGFEYSAGTYVAQKQFARWAIMCTGLLVIQLNLKVNLLFVKLSVLGVKVSIQIWEYQVIFSLYTDRCRGGLFDRQINVICR